MSYHRLNCGACYRLLEGGNRRCERCRRNCHFYCITDDTFWDLPTKTICRRCKQTAIRNRELVSSVIRQIRDDTTALSAMLQFVFENLLRDIPEDEEDVDGFTFYLGLLQDFIRTLRELHLNHQSERTKTHTRKPTHIHNTYKNKIYYYVTTAFILFLTTLQLLTATVKTHVCNLYVIIYFLLIIGCSFYIKIRPCQVNYQWKVFLILFVNEKY